MSSIINAGTSGVTITGSTSTVLSLATNGTTRATIDASGNVSLASGNLTFSSTGQRITGDMSNATVSNRLIFQTSTVSGNTAVGATPNAAAGNSSFNAFNASDVNNSSFAGLGVTGSVDVRLQSGLLGTGTYLPMTFYTGGSERMRLDTSGNALLGTTTGLAGSRLTVVGGGTQLSPGTTPLMRVLAPYCRWRGSQAAASVCG